MKRQTTIQNPSYASEATQYQLRALEKGITTCKPTCLKTLKNASANLYVCTTLSIEFYFVSPTFKI